MAVKLIIKTAVWQGEYDADEFPFPHTAKAHPSRAGYLLVTEEVLLNPESTVTLQESGAPGM